MGLPLETGFCRTETPTVRKRELEVGRTRVTSTYRGKVRTGTHRGRLGAVPETLFTVEVMRD